MKLTHIHSSYVLCLNPFQRLRTLFLIHRLTITPLIWTIILHRLNSLRKRWDPTKFWICLHLKQSSRNLQDRQNPSARLALAKLPIKIPKDKDAKHHMSSFKTSFKPQDSSFSSTSSKSRSRSLTSNKLLNWEPFRVFHHPAV